MEYSKLYNPKKMNSYQFIALTGFIMCVLAQLLLWVSGKHIENFWAVYVIWAIVYLIGSILNLNSDPEKDHHHHH